MHFEHLNDLIPKNDQIPESKKNKNYCLDLDIFEVNYVSSNLKEICPPSTVDRPLFSIIKMSISSINREVSVS